MKIEKEKYEFNKYDEKGVAKSSPPLNMQNTPLIIEFVNLFSF